jgi:hypothetical protein
MSIDVVITEIAIATELSISSFVTNWIYGFNLHKLLKHFNVLLLQCLNECYTQKQSHSNQLKLNMYMK